MHRIDASDAATGLPPMVLGPDTEPVALVLAGTSAGQSIVTIPGTDDHVAVKYVYLRGVLLPDDDPDADPDADPVWLQRVLAFPVELVPAVIAALKST